MVYTNLNEAVRGVTSLISAVDKESHAAAEANKKLPLAGARVSAANDAPPKSREG